MKTLRFKNLIDSNTGKTVEIEVPDDFDENNPTFKAAGERGKAFGERINKVVAGQLREVEIEMFKRHGFGK